MFESKSDISFRTMKEKNQANIRMAKQKLHRSSNEQTNENPDILRKRSLGLEQQQKKTIKFIKPMGN